MIVRRPHATVFGSDPAQEHERQLFKAIMLNVGVQRQSGGWA
jgi:hypothetical protein